VRASGEILELIRGYYELMDAGRLDECERYFTPDATLKIAHHPEIVGWEAIDRVMRAGLSNPMVKGITHEVKHAWEEDGNVAVFEVHATYALADGRTVVVPGVVIADVEDGRFRRQRIAADLSPIYSG